MKKLVQCELVIEKPEQTIHVVTWVEESTKPKPGMVLSMKGDSRAWKVAHAYTLIPMESSDINSTWRVGGL